MERRTTLIIVALITIVLIAFLIVVAIIIVPYYTQEGITARDAKEICDKHVSGLGRPLSFYAINTDGRMIRDGEFDYWYVHYHQPPDENNRITVERYKVTREKEVSSYVNLRHTYPGPVPVEWGMDSDEAYSVAKGHDEVGDYLEDNDDVIFEDFALSYRNDTNRFQWKLQFKNKGLKDIHSGEILFWADTGEVLSAEVVYY
jgi:hypothetical protein